MNACQTRISTDDYIEGAPELAVERVASSSAYDLHQKKGAYRRNGVREYLAWITGESGLVWWELREGEYEAISSDADGLAGSGICSSTGVTSLRSGNRRSSSSFL